MKNWIIGISVLTVILILATYIFIPSNLVISQITSVRCSSNEANRILVNDATWPGWWPRNNNNEKDSVYNYQGLNYSLSHKYYNSVAIDISNNNTIVGSRINVIKITIDSSLLQWESQITASRNPFTRIMQYREAVKIKNNMSLLLGNLAAFLENNSNIYGIRIEQIISKDSTLVSINTVFNSYPTTDQIYGLIDNLKSHILSEGGHENNFPMLSVKALPEKKYETIVAIPVNGKLKETSSIFNKRFVPWKTLTGDVKGGVHSVENALLQMQIYIDDHQRNPMGIPFQSLITDRRTEPDTSKWITKICQAVS